MKKFLLSLAVLFAGMSTAQTQYKAVNAVAAIEEGVPYLLASDSIHTSFLTWNGEKNLTVTPNDSAVVEFVSAGETTAEGHALYYIKFSNLGVYVADQEMTDGVDSFDMLNLNTTFFKYPFYTTTTEKAKAAKWTVLPAETREKATTEDADYVANWRVWTATGTEGNLLPPKNAFVIMRDALSDGGKNAVYLEEQSDYTMFAPWGNNDWYICNYAEMKAEDYLTNWWSVNYPEGIDGILNNVGNRAGQYKSESVTALQYAYELYEKWAINGEGHAAVILEASKMGKDALEFNNMVEGYYYLVSKRGSYVAYDNNGDIVGKANFEIPVDGETGENSVTLETSKYLWYFSPVEGKENAFTIQNFGTSKYGVNQPKYNTTLKTGDEGDEFFFEMVDGHSGVMYIYHVNEAGIEDCAWNIFDGWTGSPVGNWKDARNDEGNYWHLYAVASEKVEALNGDDVVQYNKNQVLQALYDKVEAEYDEDLYTYTKDENFASHGLLTEANLTIVDANGNSAIHPTDGAGSVLGLLDNDASTFTHTKWEGVDFPHYFEIDLGAGYELDAIALKMMRRNGNGDYNSGFGFGEVKVYGRNSSSDVWNECANLTMTYDIDLQVGTTTYVDYVGTGSCELGAKYRYLRIQHYKTIGEQENTYFAAAEFALYPAYDVVLAELAKAKAELDAGQATEEQIAALQVVYDRYVKNSPIKTIDGNRLKDAIDAAETIADNLPVGENVGSYPQVALDTYRATIDEVKATVKSIMSSVEIEAGVERLEAAKAELLKSLNMIETGYYQMKIGSENYQHALLISGLTTADVNGFYAGTPEFVKPVDKAYTRYENSIPSVWHFEVGQDNKVAVRSLASGLYLQSMDKNNYHCWLGEDKVYLELQVDGLNNEGYYNFILGAESSSNQTFYANIQSAGDWNNGYLVAWAEANGNDNSTFVLKPIDIAEFAHGVNNCVLGENKKAFLTYPYDCKVPEQNAKLCEVLGYYEDAETGEKAVYFQALESGATLLAGQAYLAVTPVGTDYVKVVVDDEVVTPESFNYYYGSKSKNGLVGSIYSQSLDEFYGVLNAAGRLNSTAVSESSPVYNTPRFSGYIDARDVPVLNAAPQGEDIVKVVSNVTIDGLNGHGFRKVVLTDSKEYVQDYVATADLVSLTRNFSNTKWQAWYAPFEMNYDDISDNFKVATLNDVHQYDNDDDGEFESWALEVLSLQSGDVVEANKPYMIQAKTAGAYTFNVENTTLYTSEEAELNCSSVNLYYTFHGVYAPRSGADLATNGCYVMSGGRLLTPTSTTTLKPFRWYLQVESRNGESMAKAPKQILVFEKDEFGTTGIEGAVMDDERAISWPADVYDLNGRLVMKQATSLDALPKGVYMIDGVKVLK